MPPRRSGSPGCTFLPSYRAGATRDTLVQIAQACGYKLVLEGNGEKIELDPEPFVNQVVVEYDPSSIERPGN